MVRLLLYLVLLFAALVAVNLLLMREIARERRDERARRQRTPSASASGERHGDELPPQK